VTSIRTQQESPPRLSAGGKRPAVVEVTELRKRFPVRRGWVRTVLRPRERRSQWALDGVTFAVGEGECFGILGPNGAGKTTLFKVLATLVLPDGGKAAVHGVDVVSQASDVRAFLGPVIPEERSLNWRLSGAENLRLFAAIHRLPRGRRAARVGELLDAVGLGDAGDKIVAQYSSGMRQRLLIARALLPSPSVLLLDEPTRSLDPVATRRFWDFVRAQLIRAQGCTVLLATHDPEEALALCDRVGIMNRGKMLSVGSPRVLLARSATNRYRVRTSDPGHAAFRAEGVRVLSVSTDQRDGVVGWTELELEIAGGPEYASRVNTALVLQGVPVAHFERVQKTLSEYIADVVEPRERALD
jgi:ABC-2 type transport system ATP-binding protein